MVVFTWCPRQKLIKVDNDFQLLVDELARWPASESFLKWSLVTWLKPAIVQTYLRASVLNFMTNTLGWLKRNDRNDRAIILAQKQSLVTMTCRLHNLTIQVLKTMERHYVLRHVLHFLSFTRPLGVSSCSWATLDTFYKTFILKGRNLAIPLIIKKVRLSSTNVMMRQRVLFLRKRKTHCGQTRHTVHDC